MWQYIYTQTYFHILIYYLDKDNETIISNNVKKYFSSLTSSLDTFFISLSRSLSLIQLFSNIKKTFQSKSYKDATISLMISKHAARFCKELWGIFLFKLLFLKWKLSTRKYYGANFLVDIHFAGKLSFYFSAQNAQWEERPVKII